MIAKPTTEQILDDCSRELMEVVLPAVNDATVQVTIYMMDLVLRNAAQRAAHEIAWMTDEIRELEAFAEAMEAAMAAGDEARTRAGTSLLTRRVGREQEVMCGWSPVGR